MSCPRSRQWWSRTRTARSSSAAPSRPSRPATPTTTYSIDAFRTGAGVGWHQHDARLYSGIVRLFRPGYAAHLVEEWLPALDGVVEKLRAGASVADVGCGLGASTVIMAQRVRAFDVCRLRHPRAVDRGRPESRDGGRREPAGEVRGRVGRRTFPARATTSYACSTPCTTWATRSAPRGTSGRRWLPDGTLLLVEPSAGDALEDNLNPIGRTYYGLSTVICTPGSLSQEVGLGLGAQAGERRLTAVLREAGFSHVRRAAETPFNIILEAKP